MPCGREKRINDAVRFAQETLSPLRGIMSHRSKEYDAMLHDTVALIAYEDAEVGFVYNTGNASRHCCFPSVAFSIKALVDCLFFCAAVLLASCFVPASVFAVL